MKKPYKSGKTSGAVPVAALFITASAIIMLGAIFGVYAVINNVSFSVMGTKIPAVVFAAVIVFLGARYFLATKKLWSRIKGREFSWKNFRKQAKKEPPKSTTFWGKAKNVKGEA